MTKEEESTRCHVLSISTSVDGRLAAELALLMPRPEPT